MNEIKLPPPIDPMELRTEILSWLSKQGEVGAKDHHRLLALSVHLCKQYAEERAAIQADRADRGRPARRAPDAAVPPRPSACEVLTFNACGTSAATPPAHVEVLKQCVEAMESCVEPASGLLWYSQVRIDAAIAAARQITGEKA